MLAQANNKIFIRQDLHSVAEKFVIYHHTYIITYKDALISIVLVSMM